MMDLSLPGASLFAPSRPSLPPPPPPLPKRDDPAIAEAKKKTRLSLLQRKGRGATFLTPGGGLGLPGEANIARPAATVLGG